MGSNSEHLRPAQVVARRVVEARESRGWTQAKLARRLSDVGYNKSRSTLTKLEGGQYRNVSVDDVFALAAALGVPPVYLLTPLEDIATVAVTPNVRLPAALVRAWIRGQVVPPMLPDVDLLQIPESELLRLIENELTRDMSPIARSLLADELKSRARLMADEIRRKPDEYAAQPPGEWESAVLEKEDETDG